MLPKEGFKEAGLLSLRACASRWSRKAFAFKRLISYIAHINIYQVSSEIFDRLTIFFTCSGVRGDLGSTPECAATACGGGVEGLSVIVL